MIYFCADDYGLSAECNSRIENCIKNGVLNKISILPNGEITDLNRLLSYEGTKLSLHINLVEGSPLCDRDDIPLLISDEGYFKYSFIGLFFLSLSPKRKELEKQIHKEIQSQIKFRKTLIGENIPVLIDSHQHTHMIPLIFKTLMRVIRNEGIDVEYLRIPSEPLLPYILTPSLYFSYSITGLVKQWLLKFLGFVNRSELKKSKISSGYFMGVLFSGNLNEKIIKKILPRYIKKAEKNQKDIEIGFHPGYIKKGEKLICGIREDFCKFYYSVGRNTEYDTLLKLKK